MTKKTYEAPVVEQMECKVEKGFLGSGSTEPQQVEQFTSGGTIDNAIFS